MRIICRAPKRGVYFKVLFRYLFSFFPLGRILGILCMYIKHLINKEIESSLKGGFDNNSVAILSDKMKLYLGLKCISEENYCLLLILRCVAVKGTKTFVHN